MAGQYKMIIGPERDEMVNRWGVEIEIKENSMKKICWTKPMGEMVKLN